jgi:uncharacterized protein YcnI
VNKLVIASLLAACGSVQAHVTLDQPQALAGTSFKVALRVGHGCDGQATSTISVRIPEGFAGAKPMPKPGWVLEIKRAPLAQPYESHGRKISDDVVQITWKAASREAWLQDAWYDEFVLRGQTPATAGPLWFKVLQGCEKSEADWAEVPASGTATQGLKFPAALLEVLPNEHAGHVH